MNGVNSAATYLPVFVQENSSKMGEEDKPMMMDKNSTKDPLYAALMGDNIGSTMGLPMNTLDEPVPETIKRDLEMVYGKAKQILMISDPESSLREWDMWGPLVNSLLLSSCLGVSSSTSASPVFTTAFALIWIGAMVTVANARLLGYRLPMLPTVSFVGYCLAPLAALSVFLLFSPNFIILKLLVLTIGTAWSITASLRVLELEPALEDRRILASYPFALYFCLISWIIFVV